MNVVASSGWWPLTLGAVASNSVIPVTAVQGGRLRPLPPRATRIRTAHAGPEAIAVRPRQVLVFLANPALMAVAGQLRGDQRRRQAYVDVTAPGEQRRLDHDAPMPVAMVLCRRRAEHDLNHRPSSQAFRRPHAPVLALGLAVDLDEVDAEVPVRHARILRRECAA